MGTMGYQEGMGTSYGHYRDMAGVSWGRRWEGIGTWGWGQWDIKRTWGHHMDTMGIPWQYGYGVIVGTTLECGDGDNGILGGHGDTIWTPWGHDGDMGMGLS